MNLKNDFSFQISWNELGAVFGSHFLARLYLDGEIGLYYGSKKALARAYFYLRKFDDGRESDLEPLLQQIATDFEGWKSEMMVYHQWCGYYDELCALKLYETTVASDSEVRFLVEETCVTEIESHKLFQDLLKDGKDLSVDTITGIRHTDLLRFKVYDVLNERLKKHVDHVAQDGADALEQLLENFNFWPVQDYVLFRILELAAYLEPEEQKEKVLWVLETCEMFSDTWFEALEILKSKIQAEEKTEARVVTTCQLWNHLEKMEKAQPSKYYGKRQTKEWLASLTNEQIAEFNLEETEGTIKALEKHLDFCLKIQFETRFLVSQFQKLFANRWLEELNRVDSEKLAELWFTADRYQFEEENSPFEAQNFFEQVTKKLSEVVEEDNLENWLAVRKFLDETRKGTTEERWMTKCPCGLELLVEERTEAQENGEEKSYLQLYSEVRIVELGFSYLYLDVLPAGENRPDESELLINEKELFALTAENNWADSVLSYLIGISGALELKNLEEALKSKSGPISRDRLEDCFYYEVTEIPYEKEVAEAVLKNIGLLSLAEQTSVLDDVFYLFEQGKLQKGEKESLCDNFNCTVISQIYFKLSSEGKRAFANSLLRYNSDVINWSNEVAHLLTGEKRNVKMLNILFEGLSLAGLDCYFRNLGRLGKLYWGEGEKNFYNLTEIGKYFYSQMKEEYKPAFLDLVLQAKEGDYPDLSDEFRKFCESEKESLILYFA